VRSADLAGGANRQQFTEMAEPWIQQTQETLGALIQKPKLTDKYLTKPPFRFLHDIVMEVIRLTTFAQGLYTPEECDAGSLKDKPAKVEFLNKIIACVSAVLGAPVDVSANKIVAGLEPEKTNAFLQSLHVVCTTMADKSPEAVRKVLTGEAPVAKKKRKEGKVGEVREGTQRAEGAKDRRWWGRQAREKGEEREEGEGRKGRKGREGREG